MVWLPFTPELGSWEVEREQEETVRRDKTFLTILDVAACLPCMTATGRWKQLIRFLLVYLFLSLNTRFPILVALQIYGPGSNNFLYWDGFGKQEGHGC